ncbi:MAG: bifunctional metallophosphatase/5'-nucleotidase [Elusimicrobia bacterium]|nr:bifunctional metallophosphatase/5'-nucleotidase [Elusimicrobiota bacterium]
MRTTLIFALLFAAVPSGSGETAPSGAENIKIQLFHTNDIHGWMMSRPVAFLKNKPGKEADRLIGGAPALANALKRYSAPGIPALFFDSGDWYQGTPEGSLTRGKAMVDVFNALKYDALTIGNHDFDGGEDNLKQLIAGLGMPVLGSNVLQEADGRRVPYLKPFIVKEVAGVKVGVFALLTSLMPTLGFPKDFQGLVAADEVEWGKKTVAEIKAAGADVVILLSHAGFSYASPSRFIDDKAIAAQVPGIDVILGGHSHTALKEPFRDTINGTLIAQAGGNLTRVGRILLEIDPSAKKVVRSEGRLYDLWVDELGEDADVLKVVRKQQKESGGVMDLVIGASSASMGRANSGESLIGDWASDCMRKYTKTQVALINSSGLRGDISPGPVKYRDVFNMIPFDNRVVTLNMTGAQIREALDVSFSGEHGILQVSGLSLTCDPAAPRGRRVREAAVGDKALRDAQTYSVTAPDFLAVGGLGMSSFTRGTDKAFMPVLMRDVLEWCVREYSPVQAPAMGRIHKKL